MVLHNVASLVYLQILLKDLCAWNVRASAFTMRQGGRRPRPAPWHEEIVIPTSVIRIKDLIKLYTAL